MSLAMMHQQVLRPSLSPSLLQPNGPALKPRAANLRRGHAAAFRIDIGDSTRDSARIASTSLLRPGRHSNLLDAAREARI